MNFYRISLTHRQGLQFGDHGIGNDPGTRCVRDQELHMITFVFCLQYSHLYIRAVKLFRHGLRPIKVITRLIMVLFQPERIS